MPPKAVPPGGREVTRKKRRRREREAKKAKRLASQRGRRGSAETLRGQFGGAKEAGLEVSRARRPLSRGSKQRFMKEKEGRKRRPTVSMEEREVSRLEKLLKMKKRKTLPTSFRDDGLDYLLNLTDQFGDSGNWNDQADESDFGLSSEEEPLEAETRTHRARGGGRRRRREGSEISRESESTNVGAKGGRVAKDSSFTSSGGKRVRFELDPTKGSEDESDVVSGGEGGEGGEGEEESDSESESFEEEGESDGYIDGSGDSEEEEGADAVLVKEGGREGEEEEEEGRRGDRYLPPHVRDSRRSLQRTANLEKLQKTLQGLVNRLNESNIQSICTQLEQMYTRNSRNDMNSCLTEVLLKACVSPALLSERFAMLHAMLVAILHSNIGSEVGAYVVQTLAQKLDSLLSQSPNYGRGKECDCVVLLMASLYNFKVIHCVLVYDIIRKLMESFTERDVELLLLLLKNTGMEIRRDDATSLKDIVLQIQSKAASSNLSDSSRVRFMLDTINALKTNNSRKIPNYDPSLLDHMRRLLRGLVRSKGPADENQLKISLKDLLLTRQQGRWWVVGSAWSGRESTTSPGTASGPVPHTTESWVLDLARRQRMNTDVRRNIFCILMTSEDCVDAFEKLLRLGLKDKQEREIIRVIVDCCLQEKTFNRYYAFLGQKFCELNRTHQVTFQYSLWDRLKALSDLTVLGRSNLRQLIVHLVTSQALSLAVLKVVEFTELSKEEVKFHKNLLHTLLMNCPKESCIAMFSRLTTQPRLKLFRDSLMVFMKQNLVPRPPPSPSLSTTSSQTEERELQTRLQQVEQVMRTPYSTV